MKRILTLTCWLLLTAYLPAQLGVQLSANFNSSSSVFITGAGAVEQIDFEPGPEVALNYWFRLPRQRVEFLPTLYYAQSSDDWANADDNLYLKELGAQLKVNIYPFDFLGDCDCPTFGKQGPQLQKGLYLQLAAGYALYEGETDDELTPSNIGGNGFTYGLGLGLDIGLSNLVTLSPIVAARFGTSPFQEVQLTDVNGLPVGTEGALLRTLQAGVLVAFRFDYKRY